MEEATGVQHWGATAQEWQHFREIGLAADLLPVVQGAGSAIHPKSVLKSLGKVPSRYDREGLAVGFPKWPQHHATPRELGVWAAEPNTGICINTRRVRGLDIDITDPALAAEVELVIFEHLGVLPQRGRSNSSKSLFAFIVEGFHPKRRFVCAGENNIVEFLANGQQFIAAGAHWSSKPNKPSGSRYEWAGGLPTAFPTVTIEAFNALWADLVDKFAVSKSTVEDYRERRQGDDLDLVDPVAVYLDERGLVIGGDGDKLFVECPWKHEHTSDNGPTETTWLLAGTRGYEQGHFNCMHAHCAGRGNGEFINAIGFDIAGFEDLTKGEGEGVALAASSPSLRGFDLDKDLRPKGTLLNVVKALGLIGMAGCEFGFDDAINGEVVRRSAGCPWVEVTDISVVRLRHHLERLRFNPIGPEIMRGALSIACHDRRFDSLLDRVDALVWDGVPRVDHFLMLAFGCPDTAYTRAVSRYWWTGHAGRVLQPGVQADMVPVLVGAQGLGKTQGIKAMQLDPGHYAEFSFGEDDKTWARKMRGKTVGELAELRGLRTAAADHIKARITRQREEWDEKFKERMTHFYRRLLFVGSTNEDEFLDDPTGERRWLPVRVGTIDLAWIEANREQLWAEGAAAFKASGIAWQEAQRLAVHEHEEFKVSDPWQQQIADWLAANPKRDVLQVRDVLVEACFVDLRGRTKHSEQRVGKILHALGWSKRQARIGGANGKFWFAPVSTMFPIEYC